VQKSNRAPGGGEQKAEEEVMSISKRIYESGFGYGQPDESYRLSEEVYGWIWPSENELKDDERLGGLKWEDILQTQGAEISHLPQSERT